jgi:hypothetical protein
MAHNPIFYHSTYSIHQILTCQFLNLLYNHQSKPIMPPTPKTVRPPIVHPPIDPLIIELHQKILRLQNAQMDTYFATSKKTIGLEMHILKQDREIFKLKERLRKFGCKQQREDDAKDREIARIKERDREEKQRKEEESY